MIHIRLIQVITHTNRFLLIKGVIRYISLAYTIALSSLCLAQDNVTEPQDSSSEPPAPISPPPVMRQTLSNIQNNRQISLESQYPAGVIKKLGSEGNMFIGLYEKDKTGNPYGAMLIVHGEGQNADWPHTISTIRQELPEYGWTSLSITLPEPAKPFVPARPTPQPATPKPSELSEPGSSETEMVDDQAAPLEATPNNDNNTMANQEAETDITNEPSETLDIKSAEEIEALALERLKEAVSFLNSEGQFNIVVAAHGTAALRTMNYLAGESTVAPGAKDKNGKPKIQRPLRAMVFLNARNSLLGIEKSLTELLDMQDFPILDIYFDEHHLDTIEAKARKKAAKSDNMDAYFLVKLLTPTHSIFDNENRFTRRVRGFLDQHARGVEVESKR